MHLKRKWFVFLLLILAITIFIFFMMPFFSCLLNDKYRVKTQLTEGFISFSAHKQDLLEAYKLNNQCPDSWMKRDIYKYVHSIRVLTNDSHNKCYFIVTMRDDNRVFKKIRGISLIFPINLNLNKRNCYTNINKEYGEIVTSSTFCNIGIPEDIEEDKNSFKFKAK